MNKLNPLLEAMNNIDENIVSDVMSQPRKQPRKFKLIPIAAAAAVLFTATAITAIATLKAPQQVTINDTPVEPTYKTYLDDLGRRIDMYIYDVPKSALGEEVEGYTPVGDIKAVRNPEYPQKWSDWMIVDEAGNVFHTGINNKYVHIYIRGENSGHGFAVMNLLDGYGLYEIHNKIEGSDRENVEIYFLPAEQGEAIIQQELDERRKQKGLPPITE